MLILFLTDLAYFFQQVSVMRLYKDTLGFLGAV